MLQFTILWILLSQFDITGPLLNQIRPVLSSPLQQWVPNKMCAMQARTWGAEIDFFKTLLVFLILTLKFLFCVFFTMYIQHIHTVGHNYSNSN